MTSDDEQKRPRLTVASETSEAEIERQRAEEARQDALADVDEALRELTGNLMRVSRGAGKPYYVAEQCQAVIEAFQAYRSIAGMWPSSDRIARAVRIAPADPFDPHVDHGLESVIRGALQAAASRLIGPRIHQIRGEHEIMEGITEIQRERERRRADWEAEWRAKQPGAPARKGRAKRL